MTSPFESLHYRVQQHLDFIYPDHQNKALVDELLSIMGLTEECHTPEPYTNHWNESDAVLITYGDSIRDGEVPLKTLHEFLKTRIGDCVSAVHILPFFPYSSDDGFAVIDYNKVNPDLGMWEDISAIAGDYRLMSDLVVNHCSSQSDWFQNYRKGRDPGKGYFIEASPEDPLSQVVRPRNTPLLTEVDTADGKRHVWCTFSADQLDLNFRNPEVLKEFVRIIRYYLDHGVNIFRMDAVAFLWKSVGTSCIHLQQTHEIIKLFRTLIEHHTKNAIIITETNVPNRENLTYFGNANEAHLVYNFSLPPLLIYTLLSGDCRLLKTWMMSMPPARHGTTYLNFIASHDGIGLRPLDGLLEDGERDKMVESIKAFGGEVTYRKAREGHDKPYELNISLFDALKGTFQGGEDQWQIERFLCAHAIMLSLEGIPAIYIHSLLGTQNDIEGFERTGRTRSINRKSWTLDELEPLLDNPSSHHHQVFDTICRYLSIRRKQAAFHPNAVQYTLQLGTEVFAYWRQSRRRGQSIFCISNITDREQAIKLSDINLIRTDDWYDLISGNAFNDHKGELILAPYQTVWLTNRDHWPE